LIRLTNLATRRRPFAAIESFGVAAQCIVYPFTT
jgi:hypothetical protein